MFLGHHLGFEPLLDRLLTMFTNVLRGIRLALVPAQALELKPLQRAAMGARHMIAALIAQLILPLDPAGTRYCRG